MLYEMYVRILYEHVIQREQCFLFMLSSTATVRHPAEFHTFDAASESRGFIYRLLREIVVTIPIAPTCIQDRLLVFSSTEAFPLPDIYGVP